VLDHLLPRHELPRARAPCPGSLLGRRKQRLGADLVQVVLRDVIEQFPLGRRPDPAGSEQPRAPENTVRLQEIVFEGVGIRIESKGSDMLSVAAGV
jgi:hypothetical protein